MTPEERAPALRPRDEPHGGDWNLKTQSYFWYDSRNRIITNNNWQERKFLEKKIRRICLFRFGRNFLLEMA